MQSSPRPAAPHVDKVRASRDGHAYHEAWAARVALELLLPDTTLRRVAIEGFSVEDAATGLSQEAHDIADLVRYRGSTEAASSTAVEVVQDFTENNVDDLARLFDCAAWQVKDACVAWIRGWSSSVQSMHDCPRCVRGFNRNGYGRWSSHPQRDRWGGHLAWHALMLIAGQFLAQRPVSGNPWEEEPWQSWIAGELLSRADGLWLADGTDLFPPELRRPVVEDNSSGEGGDREMASVPSKPGVLSALAGLKDEALGAQLIVDGWWHRLTAST